MMMRSALSSGLFFFLSPVLLLLLIIPAINATQGWFKSVCINQTGYYTTNSTYQTNLHGLLSSLTSYNITTYAFYSWSFGENPDEVYATGLCRGDLKPDECKSCLNDSESLLTQRCPKHKAAIGWSPSCTLRYSNHQLFGIMQIEPAFSYQSLQSVLSDPDSFSQGLKALLGNLTIRALGGEGFFSNFAEGSFNVSATDNIGVIYGMVQCSPDLTASDCEYCISHGLEIIDDYCYGKTYAFVGLPSCNVAYNLTPFYDLSVDVLMHLSPQQTPHQLSFPAVSLSAPPPTEGKGKSKNASRTVTIVVVSTLIAFLLFLLCIWRENSERNMRLRNIRGTPGESHIIQIGDRLRATPPFPEEHDTSELPIFDFGSILVATDNFSIKNKLGQGGFGPVYKGRLQDGTEVAVKRLSSSSGQGVEEFKNEMILISKLQHRNLVRLIGCCVENEEKLLIYEFMPNKSLDNFIFDPRSRAQFNWTTRFNVIKGVAKGLVYLHRDSRLRIIHRDLKVSNILLDEKMNPKISDFGLARIFQGTLELADTRRIVGTLGYMSPEYALGGIFSEKSDVFSFGILILEIVSGRKNTSFHYCDQHLNLIAYAWDLWSESRGLDIVDKALEDSYSSTEAMRCIHIGLLCIQDKAIDRPTMPDVVFMLCSETDRPQPKQPLYTCQRSSSVELQQQNDSNCSANKFTMSTVEGR